MSQLFLPKRWIALIVMGVLVGQTFIQPGFAEDSNGPEERALDHVRLQLKWTHQFQFAGYYAAIEKGYYRDAGLDVELLEGKPGLSPVDVVMSGGAEFGVGTSSLVLERAHRKPVVALAVIYQHSPLTILARGNAGIGDIEDLVGRPIMIEPEEQDVFAYFKNEGIDPSKLTVLPHSFKLQDFLSGKVDAMTAYSTDEPYELRSLGFRFLEFNPREGGVDFYGDNLFTDEQEIRDHPDRVRAFRAASLQGWAYALAHQDEIVDLIEAKYNRGRSKPQLLFEAKQTERLMHPELIEVGYMNPGRWQHIQDTFQEQGLLPKPIPLTGFLYDPNPSPNLKLLYALLTGFALIAVGALVWLFPLLYLARRRRIEIERRVVVERELLASMERTEEALAAQSRFLAVLSHEVRSPIGGISKLLELILKERDSKLEGPLREDISVVQQSAQRLYQLVDELLEWSRCEADGVEIEWSPIRLEPFVEDLQKLFMPLAETKNLALSCTIGEGVPDTILCDELRLRQILSNLLANAIKFTAKGYVSLTVLPPAGGTVVKPNGRCRLLFDVQDTGIGISAASMSRLFKPYQQADSSISRKFGGTGLGLSISLHFAKRLGGNITVKSEPEKGSTFTLEIEAEALDAAAVSGAKTTSPAQTKA